jgi:UDP-N-acetylmuramoylalanine--D-glutamate ligase
MAVLDPVAVRGREFLASLAGRRVLVVGLARSGLAAARLLRTAGAEVVAVDDKPEAALADTPAALRRIGARLALGADADVPVRGAYLVVVSPGVALTARVPAAAREAGVPVIGELELGWRAMEAETIAITGTNGKTTTTALTGSLLAEQVRPVLVAGNIGTPLTAHALTFPADGLVVAEASSFQLETIEHFHPRVAVVLNLAPDHLDRHGSFAAYVEAKARLFANQTEADCAVLNADDDATRALAARTRARVVWFSRQRALEAGVFVQNGWITASLSTHPEEISPVAEIVLRGAHNLENVLAATACALWAGIAPDRIRRSIARFRGVPHRIEPVRDLRGVRYYNDSKGTNVASTITAIASFTERIVLIAGGQGKGQDWAPLAAAARDRVQHAILIGVDAPKLARAFAAAGVPVTPRASLADAVILAQSLTAPGDVVLLSPACASFDMFDSFEHRGDTFRTLVQGLV